MLVLKPQALVVQALLSEVLDLQEPLHNLEHGAVQQREGQVAQRSVGQALLEGAAGIGWAREVSAAGPGAVLAAASLAPQPHTPGQLLDEALQRGQELIVPLLLPSPVRRLLQGARVAIHGARAAPLPQQSGARRVPPLPCAPSAPCVAP